MESRSQDVEGWARARELFLDLADLDTGERGQELDRIGNEEPELRTWVERLLEQDAGEVPSTPQHFGPYESIRHLASGGMGEVHLARRNDGEFEREVAVKLLRPGLGSEELVQRFLRERQTLAQLDHEYVARLLDGGTTDDGQPYLVMEYVEGRPIDTYCRAERLSLTERLELFVNVCAAVRHAHERGVIHRDLKPGNILVREDGTPRLLDFGIARPRAPEETPGGPLTRTGHRLFTPEYASPEQVRGEETDETTDIFALGVLLYVLLTDEHPWPLKAGFHELERAICEGAPRLPSRHRTGTARRSLTGDLDTIVLKCLAPEPRDRYVTIGTLVEDLERHLRGYPILARRTGIVQRAWRFGRRKPWHLVGAVSLVVAAVAGGVAVKSERANERQRVQLAAAIETQVESARSQREQGRFEESRAQLLDALARLESLPSERYLRALIHGQLAVVANHERRFDRSLEELELAEEFVPYDDPRCDRLRATLLNQRAYALAGSRRFTEAAAVAEEALVWCREHLEPGHELIVDALLELADQHRDRAEYEAATERLEEAAAEARLSGDEKDEGLARVLNLWGLTLEQGERHEEALEKLREAHSILNWHYGERHVSTAIVRDSIGLSLYALERNEEAEEQFAKAVLALRGLNVARLLGNALERQGMALYRLSEYERAESCFLESREQLQSALPPQSSVFWRIHYRLGRVRDEAGDAQGARESLEAALVLHHGAVMIVPKFEADARFRLGRILLDEGETAAGLAELERALVVSTSAFGADAEETLAVRELLGG